MRSVRLAVILDCCCVLLFVIIGRASHTKGESLGGIASTAWPFLAGLAGGWLAARAWRRPSGLWPAGVGAWLGTAGLGMVFRVVSGQGTAAAFIGVALAFLGLFLLGWRLLARLGGRPRAARWRIGTRACRPPVPWPREHYRGPLPRDQGGNGPRHPGVSFLELVA